MATALYPLRRLQIGLEATAGTAVAATQKLVGEAVYRPEVERYFESHPRGVRAPVTGGGTDVRKGSTINFAGELTFEEIIYPFLLGLVNDAVPTGAGPYTWDFTPVLTAPAAVKTATCEYVIGDGSTEHYERESAYMFCRSLEIQLAANQPAKMSFELVGRSEKTSTVTASLTPVTGRTIVPSNLFGLWIDDTWANLGSTQKTGLIRQATLRVNFGLEPDYTLDARADLDHTGILSQELGASLQVVVEHNADAATEIGNWRTGTVRFYRLAADNGAAAGANKQITLDMAMKHMSEPDFSQDAGIELATFDLGLEYDETGTNALVATIINGLSVQP